MLFIGAYKELFIKYLITSSEVGSNKKLVQNGTDNIQIELIE